LVGGVWTSRLELGKATVTVADEKSVLLFQRFARDYPRDGDHVYPLSAVIALGGIVYPCVARLGVEAAAAALDAVLEMAAKRAIRGPTL